eukprot:scaffold2635_cov106-Isochrysis_galbana.AAC.1
MALSVTGLLLVCLLAVFGPVRAFLSVDGEVNAAKFYEALVQSKSGKTKDPLELFTELKAEEDRFYRLANDPMQYDPKKQLEAIRAFTKKAGPLLGLEDGHGPLHEMLRAARAVLGMELPPPDVEPHPWTDAKVITPLCAEFLTRAIKAHKRHAKQLKQEL